MERRIVTLETIINLHQDTIDDGNIIFEDQEKRIKLLESKMKDYSINTSIFEEAPLKEYR